MLPQLHDLKKTQQQQHLVLHTTKAYKSLRKAHKFQPDSEAQN